MAKKHKKKIYNTPKKNKHVNKSVNLNTYIKSQENPKCNVCSSILANHNNRIYCGKCQISFSM